LGLLFLAASHLEAAEGLASPAGDTSVPPFERCEIPGIHNTFRLAQRLYSGSQPEGDEALAALAKLGVTTVISVDGSKPDVAAARKHGLHYVHLPFGYDGVPTNRVAELTQAVRTANGAVFVHCHHGMHRGPTAVAIVGQATQGWTTNEAVAWMRQAGTAADYVGLYRSVLAFQKPTPAQLAAVGELPEIAETPSLVDAMVAIDEHFSKLKSCQKAGWKSPPGNPDITPDHEALLLWEQFQEIARTGDAAHRPPDFRARLAEAQRASDALRRGMPAQKAAAIETAFAKVGSACLACHQRHRNR